MANQSNDFILRILERLDTKIDDLVKGTAEQKFSLEAHTKTEEAIREGIHDEIICIKEVLLKQTENLIEYNQQLKEHMRRTELLEDRVQPLEKDLIMRQNKTSFITQHWKKVALGVSILGGLGGAIWSIIQIFGYLTLR